MISTQEGWVIGRYYTLILDRKNVIVIHPDKQNNNMDICDVTVNEADKVNENSLKRIC